MVDKDIFNTEQPQSSPKKQSVDPGIGENVSGGQASFSTEQPVTEGDVFKGRSVDPELEGKSDPDAGAPFYTTEEFRRLKPMARFNKIRDMVQETAGTYGIPFQTLSSLVLAESDANPLASVDRTSARGLGQITPIAYKQVQEILERRGEPTELDLNDPRDNLKATAIYWNWLRKHPALKRVTSRYEGAPEDIYLAAYNAGPGMVEKNWNEGGPESVLNWKEPTTHRTRYWDYYNKLRNRRMGEAMRLDVITDVMLGKVKHKQAAAEGDSGGGSGFFSQLALPAALIAATAGLTSVGAHTTGKKIVEGYKALRPFQRMRKPLKGFKPHQDYLSKLPFYKTPGARTKDLKKVVEEAQKVENKFLTPEAVRGLERELALLQSQSTNPLSHMKDWIPKTPTQALTTMGLSTAALKAPDIISSVLGGGDKRPGIYVG